MQYQVVLQRQTGMQLSARAYHYPPLCRRNVEYYLISASLKAAER